MTTGTGWNAASQFLRAIHEGMITFYEGKSCACGCEARGEPCEGQEAAGAGSDALTSLSPSEVSKAGPRAPWRVRRHSGREEER